MSFTTKKPADDWGVGRASQNEQLGSGLDPTDKLKWNGPQELGAESDLAYFVANPHARHRFRPAFRGEFSAAILSEARIQARGRDVLVLVVTDRDASGRPSTRARGLVCVPGGHA